MFKGNFEVTIDLFSKNILTLNEDYNFLLSELLILHWVFDAHSFRNPGIF